MFENSFFSPTPVDFLCEIFYEIIKNHNRTINKINCALRKMEKDINCYFKLEAYPVALTGILKGEKHETQEVFAGPFKPIIKGDVTIHRNKLFRTQRHRNTEFFPFSVTNISSLCLCVSAF